MHTYSIKHIYMCLAVLIRAGCVQLFVTLWTAVRQAPLFRELSR